LRGAKKKKGERENGALKMVKRDKGHRGEPGTVDIGRGAKPVSS